MYTGKFWQLLVVIAVAVGLCALLPGHARAAEAGDPRFTGSFCQTEEAARELAAAVAVDDDAGYWRVMRSDAACVDSRMHPRIRPLTVVLLERVFTVTRADGLVVDFWLAADQRGTLGYVWLEAEPEPGVPT